MAMDIRQANSIMSDLAEAAKNGLLSPFDLSDDEVDEAVAAVEKDAFDRGVIAGIKLESSV